jgi:nitroimidazol reductase NimA-like FMN-containing flavoprotein (pyridoxamine 5'-phosphate oxidase superfamily)
VTTTSSDSGLARALVDANAYLTLATADGAGTPWASPVWFAHEAYTAFLWVSRPGARHSRNIAERPAVGLVIFDSTVAPGSGQAVYAEAVASAVADADLDRMIAVYSARSRAQGIPAWTRQDVSADAPHRLYVARASAHYILGPGDERVPVRLDEP